MLVTIVAKRVQDELQGQLFGCTIFIHNVKVYKQTLYMSGIYARDPKTFVQPLVIIIQYHCNTYR